VSFDSNKGAKDAGKKRLNKESRKPGNGEKESLILFFLVSWIM
jgi:hypothetical protein